MKHNWTQLNGSNKPHLSSNANQSLGVPLPVNYAGAKSPGRCQMVFPVQTVQQLTSESIRQTEPEIAADVIWAIPFHRATLSQD